MADFINTIDALGDDAVVDSIINRTITEFKDDTVANVGQNAFYKCTALKTINLPNAETIGENAFYSCAELEIADLPNVKTAGENAFYGCDSLVNVSLPALQTTNMQLFQNCTSLKSVSLPEYTGALQYTFIGCSALESVHIPKATSVGNNFIGGSKIVELQLPAVVTVGNDAFRACVKLEKVDLPVCTSIGTMAFYNLPAVKTVVLRSSAVCVLTDLSAFTDAFGNPYTKVNFYIPSALIESYKAATNWSTFANQFRKLEEWTVDGTVTGELDIENRHMVRFFNDDGTLLGYKVVTTGGTATYDGTPVCSEDASWAFNGFEPAPTNVTEDMDCYAKYQEPFFATASFAEINEVCEAGNAADYMSVGDQKEIVGADGTTVYVLRVIGINFDNKVSGGKAGTTVALCLPERKCAVSLTWKGGYKFGKHWDNGEADNCESYVRNYLRTTFISELPSDLRSVIKTVTKNTEHKDASSGGAGITVRTSQETLFIPSLEEVGGLDTLADVSEGLGQYPGFSTESDRYLYNVMGSNGFTTRTAQWSGGSIASATVKTFTVSSGVPSTYANGWGNDAAAYAQMVCFCI